MGNGEWGMGNGEWGIGNLSFMRRVHFNLVRAKHDRRQFISNRQRFTEVMLRPYEYICKNEMHHMLTELFNLKSKIPNLKFQIE
ncbi:MAG: hypothetical protein P2A85_18095 [Microcoleus anatoxicus]|uniref:hypothetical protein n=1 Tax=Microcoleus anatoxicus TaxID=2705319 RepID=UPI0036700F1A